MASATRSPLNVSQGSGHHSGSPWNPRLFGIGEDFLLHPGDSVQEEVGDVATGTPMSAPKKSKTT